VFAFYGVSERSVCPGDFSGILPVRHSDTSVMGAVSPVEKPDWRAAAKPGHAVSLSPEISGQKD